MTLYQFEALGSNCEFGFVLQECGDRRPAMLRWTSINIAGLIDMLDARFDRCFDRDLIRPHVGSMVVNTRYQWVLHSALGSFSEAEFITPTSRFVRLFQIEQARVHHDVSVLTSRLRGGGICCVFSAPAMIDADAVKLRDAVDRFSGNVANRLLVVTSLNDGTITSGGVNSIDERCWYGAVDWLAPFDQANKADFASWEKLLSKMCS